MGLMKFHLTVIMYFLTSAVLPYILVLVWLYLKS